MYMVSGIRIFEIISKAVEILLCQDLDRWSLSTLHEYTFTMSFIHVLTHKCWCCEEDLVKKNSQNINRNISKNYINIYVQSKR